MVLSFFSFVFDVSILLCDYFFYIYIFFFQVRPLFTILLYEQPRGSLVLFERVSPCTLASLGSILFFPRRFLSLGFACVFLIAHFGPFPFLALPLLSHFSEL